MEPTLPTPSNIGHEAGRRPELTNEGSAIEYSNSAARPEVTGELQPTTSASVVTSTVVVQQPDLTSVASQQPLQDQQSTGSPQIADDVDVIEKEWVDKAKEIVSLTNEDPYAQEKQVSKLQADYLMKRYNKHVKLAE